MPPARPLALAALLLGVAFTGCVALPESAGPLDLASTEALLFTPLKLIDEVRSGGEPVITITPTGTILVSAHPGWTHTRPPPSPNLLTPNEYQSYIWRSTDGGESWSVTSPLPAGPKGPWLGVSDPDFAIDANGRIFFTDLGPLTHTAVVRSDDDGKTWSLGNPVMPGPVDRQWLAAYGTDVWFIANYFQEERVLKSADGGMTWTRVGAAHCRGDIEASPLDGTLYIGCGNGIDVSTDGGATWDRRDVPNTDQTLRTMAEPVVDAAGNVYTTWSTTDAIWMAGSADKGETWTAPLRLTDALPFADGTHMWPWIVAGDAGRVAVVWFGTPAGGNPGSTTGDWFVYQATVLDAMGAAPAVVAAQATDAPIHKGNVCQRGTVCQLDPTPAGDRRLGDFFEAAIDAEGYVHAAFSVTTLVPDAISHPGYVKQIGGPRLRA